MINEQGLECERYTVICDLLRPTLSHKKFLLIATFNKKISTRISSNSYRLLDKKGEEYAC